MHSPPFAGRVDRADIQRETAYERRDTDDDGDTQDECGQRADHRVLSES
jgi:hypothetical protein